MSGRILVGVPVIPAVAEVQNSSTGSQVTPPAELIEMVQYDSEDQQEGQEGGNFTAPPQAALFWSRHFRLAQVEPLPLSHRESGRGTPEPLVLSDAEVARGTPEPLDISNAEAARGAGYAGPH